MYDIFGRANEKSISKAMMFGISLHLKVSMSDAQSLNTEQRADTSLSTKNMANFQKMGEPHIGHVLGLDT